MALNPAVSNPTVDMKEERDEAVRNFKPNLLVLIPREFSPRLEKRKYGQPGRNEYVLCVVVNRWSFEVDREPRVSARDSRENGGRATMSFWHCFEIHFGFFLVSPLELLV